MNECQYVVTSKEGTSYCSLAESSVSKLQSENEKLKELFNKLYNHASHSDDCDLNSHKCACGLSGIIAAYEAFKDGEKK